VTVTRNKFSSQSLGTCDEPKVKIVQYIHQVYEGSVFCLITFTIELRPAKPEHSASTERLQRKTKEGLKVPEFVIIKKVPVICTPISIRAVGYLAVLK